MTRHSILLSVLLLGNVLVSSAADAPAPTVDQLLSAAVAKLKAGEYPDAGVAALAAIKVAPDRYEPYVILAQILARQGKTAEALTTLEQAVQRAPDAQKKELQQAAAALRQTAGKTSAAEPELTGVVRRQRNALMENLREADAAKSASERERLLREYLVESEKFAAANTNHFETWFFRAKVALELNDWRTGSVAAKRLEALGADNRNDPQVDELMGKLERQGYFRQSVTGGEKANSLGTILALRSGGAAKRASTSAEPEDPDLSPPEDTYLTNSLPYLLMSNKISRLRYVKNKKKPVVVVATADDIKGSQQLLDNIDELKNKYGDRVIFYEINAGDAVNGLGFIDKLQMGIPYIAGYVLKEGYPPLNGLVGFEGLKEIFRDGGSNELNQKHIDQYIIKLLEAHDRHDASGAADSDEFKINPDRFLRSSLKIIPWTGKEKFLKEANGLPVVIITTANDDPLSSQALLDKIKPFLKEFKGKAVFYEANAEDDSSNVLIFKLNHRSPGVVGYLSKSSDAHLKGFDGYTKIFEVSGEPESHEIRAALEKLTTSNSK